MKKLIIIFLLIIISFFLMAILFGKSNSSIISDTLKKNNYLLDHDNYRKIVTNNTQEEFYNNIKNNMNSEYIEYQYSINNNELQSTNLRYNNNYYYLCDITENFTKNEFRYSCESIYKNNQLYIKGNYDNNMLSCYNRNDNIDKEIIDKYCIIIKKQIKGFIIERNKLLSNKKFRKAVRGE